MTTRIYLTVAIDVINEERLRQFAADRMTVSGFEDDPAVHIDKPLDDLVFEALIGSNPDPMCPADMGIEINNWEHSV